MAYRLVGAKPLSEPINAGILFIRPVGTNFSEILIEILTISPQKMCLKRSFAKCPPFCLGLVLLNLMLFFRVVAINDSSEINIVKSVLDNEQDLSTRPL